MRGRTRPPQSARAHAEASVRALAGSWNPDAIFERTAPGILTPFVREALPHAYARLAHTPGDLESLQAPAAGPGGESTTIPRDGVVADYAMNAQFTSGPARIQIVVRRHGSGWQVLGLHVDSPVQPFQVGASAARRRSSMSRSMVRITCPGVIRREHSN